jgi:hypothetical protein
MAKEIQTIINESAMKILRPLVRVMLRNGVSCGSFEELVRKAYVDEAFAIGKKNQLKTTVSSVSAQTGLSRKEVKRLNELEQDQRPDVERKYNRAIRVISGWVNDKSFTDAQGNARVLPLTDESSSFADLVKLYSGDITPKAMLDLLLNAECIKVEDNKVHLIKHAYVPGKDSVEIIRILGTDTSELLNTIDHNLIDVDDNKRFQRKVSSALLNKNATEEFKKLSFKQAQAMLEELDTWLTENEVAADDDNAHYVSLGIYYYEHESSGEKR